jgi:hypothetical protein
MRIAQLVSKHPVAPILLLGFFLFLAFFVGVVLYANPAVGAGIGLALTGLLWGRTFPAAPTKIFVVSVSTLLLGYAFIGREFAHLGVPPIFVGEVVLSIGLLGWVLARQRWAAFRSPLTWILVAFATWGLLRSYPFVSVYGLDVLRDSVLWGYALIVIILVPFLLDERRIFYFPQFFSRALPWFIIWVPAALLLSYSNVISFRMKPGDMGVHLGGVGAFLLLGLHRTYINKFRFSIQSAEWLWWIAWLFAVLVVGSFNRGGFLSCAVAVGVAFAIRPMATARKVFILAGSVSAFTLALLITDFSIDIGKTRSISPSQIVSNVASISGRTEVSGGMLEQNRTWRLDWWSEIINYTFYGEYFWGGKGFGINLADDDGFQVTRGSKLRSPHNGHLTVMARMGIPGIFLWVLIHAGFATMLLLSINRSRNEGHEWWTSFFVWIFAYWTAFMVNGTFDVFLEGPQGGIWFWTVYALGIGGTLLFNRGHHA